MPDDKITKVVEFIPRISDGGAETLVKDYATKMDKAKVDVTIVSVNLPAKGCANHRLITEARAKSICLINFPIPRLLKTVWDKVFKEGFVVYRLKKVIRRIKPDAIHVHLELLTWMVKIKGQLKGIKLFYTCHNESVRFLGDAIPREHEAAKELLASTDFQIIALHGRMKDEINKLLDTDRVSVVHNGIDLERFKKNPGSRDATRAAFGIPGDAFVLGHVGRFCNAKNHGFLCDIFSEICKVKDNAHLLMVGKGPKEEEIIDKLDGLGARGRYTILSDRSDIPDLLNAMDAFIFPSFFEGFPISLIEAQACDLRCVVSDRITPDCFLTGKTVPLSIGDSASHWAKTILDTSIKGPYTRDIQPFSMENIIGELTQIYSGSPIKTVS